MSTFKAGLLTGAFVLAMSSGTAFAGADLVPDASNLGTMGQASVTNMGDEATEPSVLTIVCQKTSGGMGGCAEDPGMAAYEDAGYPNAAVIQVPALQPGETFDHALEFWGGLVWGAGTYELTLTADAGEAIEEDDEDNNQHAANENLRLGNLWDGIEMYAGLLVRLGREWGGRVVP